MMKVVRMLDIEKYISQKGTVTMDELCEQFDVSMNTVRRDVAALIKRGTVEKVYGGVCARKNEQTLTPYEQRRVDNEAAKIAVGRRAAELVRDGDIIFVDSGTTTLQMIDFLADKRDLTLITNNLEVILRALPYERITIISLPGQLRRKTNSFTGDDAVRSLKRYNIRIAFMAATGVSQHGVTNSSPLEYEIKKAAVENCECAVLMMCSAKFGVTGLMTYATLNDFDMLVTEAPPPGDYADVLKRGNTQVLLPEE